jgi:ketosteroid isomerase-like protein
MKKINFLSIIFLLVSIAVHSQSKQEMEVSEAVETFKKGVVDADKNLLESVTAENLVYGHSSGKVQNKAEFVAEIVSSQPLDYTSVDISEQTITVSGDVAVVRHIYSAETLSNGTPGKLKIGNMMIWQKQQRKWKLLARQAYKL